MTTTIAKVLGKLSDYWVCKKCNGLNWYENEVCTGENSLILGCKGKQPKLTDKRNKKTLKIKTTQLGSTGYITTRLDIGSCKKTVQLHSLVAESFLKPIEPKENKKIIYGK